MNRRSRCVVGALTCIAVSPWYPAQAKPIAFADGTTVMAECGAGTMREFQVFHAPRYFFSAGLGHLALDSDVDSRSRDIIYARVNYLPKRWNMEAAQANIFTWGGTGSATTGDVRSGRFGWNAGAQFDYGTRRVYSSLKMDYSPSAFSQTLMRTVFILFATMAALSRGHERRYHRIKGPLTATSAVRRSADGSGRSLLHRHILRSLPAT